MAKKSAKDKKKARARNACKMNVARKKRLNLRVQPLVIGVNKNYAPNRFAELVVSAVQQLDLSDPELFPGWFARVATIHAHLGEDAAIEALKPVYVEELISGRFQANTFDQFYVLEYVAAIGNAVYRLISQEERRRLFPQHSFQVFPGNNGTHFLVWLSVLGSTKTSNGTAYFSPRKPTLVIDGRPVVPSFHGHAIQRMGERKFDNRDTYLCLGDYHGIIRDCIHYEPVVLPDGQPAFTLFDSCNEPGFRSWQYVRQVLGTHEPGKTYYYRLGYFPVHLSDDFAAAKSMLLPGYRNTPEYDLLKNSSLPYQQKRAMMQKLDGWTENRLMANLDFPLIKFFHDGGIPQVVTSNIPFFEYSLVHGMPTTAARLSQG